MELWPQIVGTHSNNIIDSGSITMPQNFIVVGTSLQYQFRPTVVNS